MSDTNEQRNLLAETVEKLFRDMMENSLSTDDAHALAQGRLPPTLWQPIEDNGIASVFVPESAGGFGGGWQDAFIVLSYAAFYAVPLPIAETLLAQRLLLQADIAVPNGAIAIAVQTGVSLRRDGSNWKLSGNATGVPWGNAVQHIAIACEHNGVPYLALVEARAGEITGSDCTIAREPRADLQFDNTPALGAAACTDDIFAMCALLRTAQIAGALNAALRQSVQYANERSQFGKPIGKFQAIQHSLALLADEAAAVNCAAMAACRAADLDDAGFEIAAAKLRANRAVGAATSIAHQVHGAIGFTREHPLHFATQRLWAWRSEYGNDRYWAARLGASVAQRGVDNFWADLTARSDRA
jgi:acyl-CoA dehydrogenase